MQAQLNREKQTIAELKQVYAQAAKDVEKRIRELSMRTDMENLQTIIYQKQYQEVLKKQIDNVLDSLHTQEFATIESFLTNCYTDGYLGVMYDIAGQGIPIIMPIDPKQVVKALQTDSKISTKLYTRLGEDVKKLKASIRAELSRGITQGASYNQIAVKIAKGMKSDYNTAYNSAVRIARTEGHRIQCQSAYDAQKAAASKGADVVKQWNSVLDGRTRPHHRQLDGQIRELDEPFEIGTLTADYPGAFGRASEDCNCRCALLQRARWALDDDELETLKKRAEYFDLDKTKDFEDYQKKYLKASESVRNSGQKKNDEDTSQEQAEDNNVSRMAMGSGIDWSETVPREVSKEEKKEIMEYAKTKGINMNDISKFDGDKDVLKSQIDQLAKLREEYPELRKHALTLNVKDLDSGDFATTQNRTITLNNKMIRNREITEKIIRESNIFSEKTIEDIVTHEATHILMSIKGNKGLELAKEVYYNVSKEQLSTDEIIKFLSYSVSLYSIEYDDNESNKTYNFKPQKYKEIIPEIMVKNKNEPSEFTREFIRLWKGR